MSDWKTNSNKRLIVDNGSWEIRLGSALNEVPNLTYYNLLGIDRKNGNLLCGENLNNYKDEANLIYVKPQVRGVVVDWDHEVHLWEKMLDAQTEFESKQNELQSYSISILQNPCVPDKVRQRMIEVCFEYFGFDAIYPALSQQMSQIYALDKYNKKISDTFQLVIEIGHSATYFVPFFDGQPINYAIKRLDVGGKLLTNHLKEIITCRYIQLKNEIRMVSQIKEDMCFVSQNFQKDIKLRKGSHTKYFILPDYETGKKGFAVDFYDRSSYSDKLTLDKERFTLPEILFNPSDIGLDQCGISQGASSVIKEIHPDIREYFYENIILCGGSSNFVGLKERLLNEVTQNTPDYLDNKLVHLACTSSAYQGCQKVTSGDNFEMIAMNRNDYKEYGFEQLNALYFI
ncbi:hypothetical protein ABPG72_009167 [Tetrahymena utriculariae]